ncbi:MAG: class I SAM-dependent methyltransferase, partial [Perlucidibaca sp.]
RELACRVGTAAGLSLGDRVLDLACGRGASLRLWPEAFFVAAVTGLEHQLACVESVRRAQPARLDGIHHGRFDRLPMPAGMVAGSFDAVVCVDAAYHADSLVAFATHAAAA